MVIKKKEKFLPQPEVFASCPHEGKILDFYRSHFESVYIMLHPFLLLKSMPIERFERDDWPSKIEINEGCNPLSWKDVLEKIDLNSISEIDIGLRSIIGGLNKKFRNDVFVKSILKLAKENIILPSEGDLAPLIENRLFGSLKTLGFHWFWLGDELGTERKLCSVEEIIEGDKILAHGNTFSHDHKVLITTHWDSHFSLLCSSKNVIDNVLKLENFEGFYATEKTEMYWSVREIYTNQSS